MTIPDPPLPSLQQIYSEWASFGLGGRCGSARNLAANCPELKLGAERAKPRRGLALSARGFSPAPAGANHTVHKISASRKVQFSPVCSILGAARFHWNCRPCQFQRRRLPRRCPLQLSPPRLIFTHNSPVARNRAGQAMEIALSAGLKPPRAKPQALWAEPPAPAGGLALSARCFSTGREGREALRRADWGNPGRPPEMWVMISRLAGGEDGRGSPLCSEK